MKGFLLWVTYLVVALARAARPGPMRGRVGEKRLGDTNMYRDRAMFVREV